MEAHNVAMSQPREKDSFSIETSTNIEDCSCPTGIYKFDSSMLLVFEDCSIYDPSVARCAQWFSRLADRFLRTVAVNNDVAADRLTGEDPWVGSGHGYHNRDRGCSSPGG